MNTCKTKRYPVDQPPSWWPAVCPTTSTTTRSQVLAASSLLLKAKPEAPPPQPAPSIPAWLLYPQSCLPHSIHLQAALFEALLAVPNFFHPPGGQRSALPPPPTYFPPRPTIPYGPTDWKAAAWHLEGGNVHSVLYAPGPADALT